MKKILFILCFVSSFFLSGCTDSYDTFDETKTYGLDAYDVMETGEIVTLKLEVLDKYKASEWGYEIDFIDSFAINSADRSLEIIGTNSSKMFYSIPTPVGDELIPGEKYYIKFIKIKYPPNSRAQFGLIGTENIFKGDGKESTRDENFNYEGSFCNVNDVSRCTKMLNNEYTINDYISDVNDFNISQKDIGKAFSFLSIVETINNEDNYFVLNIDNKKITIVLPVIKHDISDKRFSELVEGQRYIIKVLINEEVDNRLNKDDAFSGFIMNVIKR